MHDHRLAVRAKVEAHATGRLLVDVPRPSKKSRDRLVCLGPRYLSEIRTFAGGRRAYLGGWNGAKAHVDVSTRRVQLKPELSDDAERSPAACRSLRG